MEKAIPLDIKETLRQLGINPTKAMELLAFATESYLSVSPESTNGTALTNAVE